MATQTREDAGSICDKTAFFLLKENSQVVFTSSEAVLLP